MKMNKKAVAGLGLGALALVGGSFAYYNQTATLDNPLKTGHYENEVVEDYTPPTDEVKPGATIDKKVGARNTGDYPVLVRIRMDEQWTHSLVDDNGNISVTPIETSNEAMSSNYYNGAFNIATQNADGTWKANQYGTQGDFDGRTKGDETVIRKNMAENYDAVWIYNEADGYWYYYRPLEAGEATEVDLLDSLSIASNIDLGFYTKKDYYYISETEVDKTTIDEKDWIEYEYVPSHREIIKNPDYVEGEDDIADEYIDTTTIPKFIIDGVEYNDQNNDGLVDAIDLALILQDTKGMKKTDHLYRRNESILDETRRGYSDANYTLKITSHFVQATPDAVAEAFPEAPEAIKNMFVDYDLDSNEQNRPVNPIEP